MAEPIDHKIKELRKRRNLIDDKKENKEEKLNILEEIQRTLRRCQNID